MKLKFSLACRKAGKILKDTFIINHVSKEKDWERLVFIGINEKEEDMRLLWFTREDFKSHIAEAYFNSQQGGKKINNDDYMCTKIEALRKSEWVHEGLSEW